MKRKDATLTSVVSYPERGVGGSSHYRGNCSPKLIEDLIRFYQPPEICDYMVGSGTTEAAAAACGINCHGRDLSRGFDLLNCDIPERSPFTFFHPPYWNAIQYAGVMYDEKEVQRQYGFNPMDFDLSRVANWEKFLELLNYCTLTTPP